MIQPYQAFSAVTGSEHIDYAPVQDGQSGSKRLHHLDFATGCIYCILVYWTGSTDIESTKTSLYVPCWLLSALNRIVRVESSVQVKG